MARPRRTPIYPGVSGRKSVLSGKDGNNECDDKKEEHRPRQGNRADPEVPPGYQNRLGDIDCPIRNRDAINSYIVDVNAALSTQEAESAA